MQGRIGVGLVVVGLVVGLLGGAVGGAAAQGSAWRIVQSADGTLYLLAGGTRYAIVGDPIDDDELAEYADGDATGTAMLLNVLRPASPPPVAERPAPAPEEVQANPPAEAPAAPVPPAAPAPPAAAPAGAAKTDATGAVPSRGQPPLPAAPAPAQPSAAELQFVSVVGNTPGQPVTVRIQAPAGSACSIEYLTPTRVRSTVAGLDPQTVDASRMVSWTFVLDPAIRSGSGTLTVTCGGASISRPIVLGGLSR